MRNISLFITLIAINNICYSQSENINYVEYQYKYLDKNFKIKISNNDYEETVKKYGFYRNRVIGGSYKDSLTVVMSKEFGEDSKKANRATFQVGYGWDRVAYHLWIYSEEAIEFPKNITLFILTLLCYS